MGLIQFTAEAYARMQKALLPPGRLWSLVPASLLTKAFLAAGDELARVSGRAADLVEESDPRTTTELIEDYERELALDATGTTQNRRDRIEELRTRQQRFRPADVKAALAVALDLAVADIDVIETSRADAIAMADDNEIYRFHVYRDPGLAGTPDIAQAQIELDTFAHSHTKGTVCESISMICDDPESLCDRDLIGI